MLCEAALRDSRSNSLIYCQFYFDARWEVCERDEDLLSLLFESACKSVVDLPSKLNLLVKDLRCFEAYVSIHRYTYTHM